MAIGDIIVGIDIGTTKVCTVVGEVNNFGQIETISSTSFKCSGLKKGKIINEDEISLSIARTIKDAEDETNLKINSAYVTFKDSLGEQSIESRAARASIAQYFYSIGNLEQALVETQYILDNSDKESEKAVITRTSHGIWGYIQ